MGQHTLRNALNSYSKATAVNDGEQWCEEELEWLQSWDGTPELLVRTIEACREKFYKTRRTGITVTRTTTTTMTYRGWMEGQGDGWD